MANISIRSNLFILVWQSFRWVAAGPYIGVKRLIYPYFVDRGALEVVDFRPPPLIQEKGVQSLYLDNHIILGLSRHEVGARRDASAAALREAGLPVHEETEASLQAILLGWR